MNFPEIQATPTTRRRKKISRKAYPACVLYETDFKASTSTRKYLIAINSLYIPRHRRG